MKNKIRVGIDEKIFDIVNYTLLTIFAIMFLYPIIYVFSAAISNPYLVEIGAVTFLPKGLSLSSIKAAMNLEGIWLAYWNSIIITVFGTIVNMFFTVSGAYVLSKPDLKFKKFWMFLVIITMWFDPGMIPKYLNFRDLGMINSYTGIILGFAINTFNVIILKSFFEAVPRSLEESAGIRWSITISNNDKDISTTIRISINNSITFLCSIKMERIFLDNDPFSR